MANTTVAIQSPSKNMPEVSEDSDGKRFLEYYPIVMNREEIQAKIVQIFEELFEFENIDLEDNLRDVHGFDSIDAIELLGEIEKILGYTLSREEKEKAMTIRTTNDIINYIEVIQADRNT